MFFFLNALFRSKKIVIFCFTKPFFKRLRFITWLPVSHVSSHPQNIINSCNIIFLEYNSNRMSLASKVACVVPPLTYIFAKLSFFQLPTYFLTQVNESADHGFDHLNINSNLSILYFSTSKNNVKLIVCLNET